MSLIDAIKRARHRHPRFSLESDPGPPIELEGRSLLLVYLFPALGDAVLLAPAVKALASAGAKRPIGLLLRPGAARIWKHIDLPVKIHLFPDELLIPDEQRGGADVAKRLRSKPVKEASAKLESELVKRRYEIAVDLTSRDEVDARRWLKASQAETRLGWIDPGETTESAHLTWGTPDERLQTARHWSRYLMLPLRSLGAERPEYDIPWKISQAARASAEKLWGEGPRVLVVPGAASEEKRWHSERFAAVGKWVVNEAHGTVVVCGAPSETKLARDVVKQIGRSAAVYTQKDLGKLLALIETADAVVSNDTGPMHFSFLLGKPTVAIFTYMPSTCWGPHVTDQRFVVLNAPESQAARPTDDAEGVWTRAAIHYLGGLLETYARGR